MIKIYKQIKIYLEIDNLREQKFAKDNMHISTFFLEKYEK